MQGTILGNEQQHHITPWALVRLWFKATNHKRRLLYSQVTSQRKARHPGSLSSPEGHRSPLPTAWPHRARLPPPHDARPTLPTCVAATRPSPLRGPAALPVLRAGEEGTVCSARTAHPAPGCHPLGRAQRRRRGGSPAPPRLALTWGAAGARREGAAPWLPTGTELEGKGTGLDASDGWGRPVLPPAPRSTLTRRQPGAQQRPDEELSLHTNNSSGLPRAVAHSTSRYRHPGLSPTGRGGRGFISRPRPALRPRPFPGHPARSPPLAPYRGPAERLRPRGARPLTSLFSFLAFWV